MISIEYDRDFKKSFKKRIISHQSLLLKYKDRLNRFIQNRHDPILKDHKLTGKLVSFRAFSIAGDVRVIYRETGKDKFVFINIGSHNQVYK